MAVKTITIDMDAYGLLSLNKQPGQSFSQVIKAQFAPRPTAGRFKVAIRDIKIGKDALDAMDKVVRDRVKSPARAARL